MNKLVYCLLLFVRIIIYCYFFLMLFQVTFPYTGQGSGLYAEYLFVIWVPIGLVMVLLMAIKPIYNLRVYAELLYVVSLCVFLLFTFVQSGDPPIYQMIKGQFPTMTQIKDGIRIFFR